MATDLKKTDVVIVGLGAVGGVAALPLARAGLEVIGLEAGTWLSPRDFAPDELRNNFRGWPQSAQKANGEIPTQRLGAVLAALLGAELAVQPVGLQSRERNHAPLWRRAHSEGLDRGGLAVRARGARTLLRQGRVRGRHFRPGRQHRWRHRQARQHL